MVVTVVVYSDKGQVIGFRIEHEASSPEKFPPCNRLFTFAFRMKLSLVSTEYESEALVLYCHVCLVE